MPPRPILKGLPTSDIVSSEAASNPLPFSSCSTILDSPHVHFPPTPTLTSTEITHSSFIYDRAPIIVSPNTCALPERGGRKFIAGNSNKGGLGYFHPHAKFQVDAVRVECESSETVSPTIFSASVTVGNVNDCGSVGLFVKKRPARLHEYEHDQRSGHDQYTQYAQHSPSSSIPHSSVHLSTRNVYYSAPPSPNFAGNSDTNDSYPNQLISHTYISVLDASGYASTSKQLDDLDLAQPRFLPPSISASESPMKAHSKQQDKKNSVDGNGKRRRKTPRVEGDFGTQRTMLRTKDSHSYDTSRELELQGCLGGF